MVILALTVFWGYRVTLLTFDNSNDIWLNEANPAWERLKGFRAEFGNEDFVYIVLPDQDFFTPAKIDLLTTLAEDLKENLPYAKTVRWIGEAEFLEGSEGELTVSRLSDFVDRGLTWPEIKRKVLAETLYQNFLFNPTGEVLAISVDLEPYPDVIDPEVKIYEATKAILGQPAYQELKALAVGPPILHSNYNELSYSEALKFLIIGITIMLIVLYAIGRTAKDALVPLLIIILSLFWSFGLTEIMGFTLNVFVILLPVLLCCATVGDSMHIIELYRQNIRADLTPKEAIVKAVGSSGAPCFITALTSAAGFLSFLTSDIPPCREMGIYASIGVMTAYVLSVFIVTVFYAPRGSAPKAAPATKPRKPDAFDRFLVWLFQVNLAHRKGILVIFTLAFILAFYGYQKVETESNTIGMLSKSLPLRQAYDLVDERIGGAMSLELVVDSFAPDGIKEPAFLAKMDELRAFLEARPEVSRTISLIDVLKNIAQALRAGDPAFYALPKTREAVAQSLLLYELADGRELDRLMSFDGRKARLAARTKNLDTQDVRALTEAILAKSKEIFGNERAVSLTGGLDWTRSMNDQMARGQRQTFTAAFITLTIIMALATRSIRLGFLSLFPNVIPVMATIGLAGSLGVYIDIPLLSFCPIIIGLVIDDTTHFLHRFREVFQDTRSYRLSLERTLLTVGRPLLFTTMTVVGAFFFLFLSDVLGVKKFGSLGVVAFILAIVADFFLMPAILLTFKPFGPDGPGDLEGPEP
jgi:predicted RND superfamily exporter protein